MANDPDLFTEAAALLAAAPGGSLGLTLVQAPAIEALSAIATFLITFTGYDKEEVRQREIEMQHGVAALITFLNEHYPEPLDAVLMLGCYFMGVMAQLEDIHGKS